MYRKSRRIENLKLDSPIDKSVLKTGAYVRVKMRHSKYGRYIVKITVMAISLVNSHNSVKARVTSVQPILLAYIQKCVQCLI